MPDEERILTIGVLGGMGPLATAAFYRELIRATQVTRDQEHVPTVIVSEPTIPDRTAYLLGQGEDPRPALIAGGRRLRAAGADLLVIPCNTANTWIDEVAAAAGLEPVSWLECAADELLRVGAKTTGLLATTGTIRTGIYQNLLRHRQVEVLIPDEAGQATVMESIYGLDGIKAAGTLSIPRAADLKRVAMELVRRGADTLLLGCTELPLALDPGDSAIGAQVIDPAVPVARRAIARAGGRVYATDTGNPT